MEHKVLPYGNQLHIARTWKGPEPAAIELQFPPTFSGRAQRVLRYYDGKLFLFAWQDKFVMTDDGLLLDDGYYRGSGMLGWRGNDLGGLEAWLEAIADSLDDWQPSGWQDVCDDDSGKESGKPRRILTNLYEAVLVKMSMGINHLIIVTVDRAHGRCGRFLVTPRLLEPLLRNDSGSMTDEDDGNFATFRRFDQNINVTFIWLDMPGYMATVIYRQSVEVPVDLVRRVFYGNEAVRYLYCPEAPRTRVKVSASPRTQDTIHRVVHGKRKIRRAFSKAMRDDRQRLGEEITLYGDGQYNFFFRTKDSGSKSGGLILGETERHGYHGCEYAVYR